VAAEGAGAKAAMKMEMPHIVRVGGGWWRRHILLGGKPSFLLIDDPRSNTNVVVAVSVAGRGIVRRMRLCGWCDHQ
jgi:hypothetical protein